MTKYSPGLKSKLIPVLIALGVAVYPGNSAKADFWGGDLPLLAQIVANTLQELIRLKQIIDNGKDTLNYMRDINDGIRDAMGILRTLNTTIEPGILSQYKSPADLLGALQNLYGMVPNTEASKLQSMQDESVSEAIVLHNQAFDYAAMVDPEAERIKDYARGVSPAGAGRLTAQSLGVLIHVSNQILRTNAAMLKIMSENLALQNRREKLNSKQFEVQYSGLSGVFGQYPSLESSMKLK